MTRIVSKVLLTAGFATGSFAAFGLASAPQAYAADACMSEASAKTLSACPNTGPQSFNVGAHGKQPQVAFHSAPQALDIKKREQQTKPNTPDQEMGTAQREQRTNVLKSRQRALLVTEISQIERLFKTTPANAPDRPTIARRLAETYVELESTAFREKTENEVKRDGLKKTNPAEAGKAQTQVNSANQIMLNARKFAIQYYTLIKDQYTNYPQLDEVLYYLAYEYEQGNDLQHARQVYYELIRQRPNSKYIPNAYLAFGELFFNEAQGDPSKWDLAAEAYKKVIDYPPPENKVYGYAWYKVAYVFWNQGTFDKALNAFKKTIDYGTQYTQLPNAAKLADSARRDIIPVYALKGDPAAAYNFFHNISGDKPGENEKTFKMMNDLGQNYLDTGHYPESIALYKDLLVRDRAGEKQCIYQAHISEATLAMKSGNKEAVKGVLDDQAKIYADVKNGNKSAEAKQECANKTAELLTETAMAWHLEAVGSGGQRGTGDGKTMLLAAGIYKRVTESFNAEEFSKFQFPRLVKEDWPSLYDLKYNMADLLYFQQKWDQCGPAFDSVVAENPTGPKAAESAYAAVLCYQNIYDAAHPKGSALKGGGNLPGQDKKKDAKADETERLKPKELTENQKGMLQSFNRYICYIKPAAGDAQGQEQLVEVKYARARTYFEGQHWEEAGLAFRDIAMNNADRDVGIYAAQLYLESVNVLATTASRPACFDDMATDVPKFIELYCVGDKATKNAEQCTILGKIQADILRLKAQGLVKVADQGGANALQTYEQAGNAYLDLYRKYCEAPIRAGQPAQAEKCDEIVYNAARSFQAGRLIAKAIAARMILLNPANQMDKSELAKKATFEIGGNYQAIAVYDLAAEWFEKYAKANPKGDKADKAMSDAVLLRLGLGMEDQAIADAKTFTTNYGASKPAETAAIQVAIGAHYAEKEEWENARKALSGSMGVIDKAAPDVQVQAHATLARADIKTRKEGEAKAEYAKVRSLWSDPAAAESRIRAAYPGDDDGQKDKKLAKALNAVGEAYFYAAEEERKNVVDKLKFPEYKGSGTKEDVLKHINTKVVAWYNKKKEAIQKVEPDYIKILELKPVPPPKWVIAAGSRSGLMWGDFVDEFRRAPIPEAWKKDAEIRGTYYDALDAASEPFKVRNAKPALEKCLKLSVTYQYFDEFSRSCEVWLAKNYKADYHVVDELRGAPTLSNGGLDDKSPPLLVGGTMWHPAPVVDPNAKAAAAAEEKATETTAKPAAGGNGGGGGGRKGGGRASGGMPGKPGKKK